MKLVLSLVLTLCLHAVSVAQYGPTLQQELAAWNRINYPSYNSYQPQRYYFRGTNGKYQGSATKSGSTTFFKDSTGKTTMSARTNGSITTFRNTQGKSVGTIVGRKK